MNDAEVIARPANSRHAVGKCRVMENGALSSLDSMWSEYRRSSLKETENCYGCLTEPTAIALTISFRFSRNKNMLLTNSTSPQ